ncbi:MAG: 3-deoxy-D-manno-octulosonic acid kinase [Bacillota bacterium]
MTVKTQATGRGLILYDEALLDHADDALFTPPAAAASPAGGRGRTFILKRGGGDWVLRHYRRGGGARFLGDRYLWTGLESTRPWREWRLLHALYKEGLPVPQPVAARVERRGFFYRGDLVTRRIDGARSLAESLDVRLPWREVGRCVRRFHDAGVWHADLNAHNILIDGGGIYLLDFDRSERRASAPGWKIANIMRLKRSLDKLSGGRFDADAWRVLLDGYGTGG